MKLRGAKLATRHLGLLSKLVVLLVLAAMTAMATPLGSPGLAVAHGYDPPSTSTTPAVNIARGAVADPVRLAKAAARLVAARRSFVAAEGGASATDTVVLGHYPEYVQAAEESGGRYFSVPESVWEAMSPEEQWAANQKFLDRAIARGSGIQLATPAEAAREGSFYERELQYLGSKGYTPAPGGGSMIPPGG